MRVLDHPSPNDFGFALEYRLQFGAGQTVNDKISARVFREKTSGNPDLSDGKRELANGLDEHIALSRLDLGVSVGLMARAERI
jgi:hypothetical protein